ncbi:reverse transcriptase domain-containing protein [Tanacetum coccineum]
MDKTMEVLKSFNIYFMKHVRRDQNKKADALSKLDLMTFSRLMKEVLVEVLPEKSIVQREVTDIIKEEGPVQAKSIIQEIHQGSCEIHAGSRSVVSKIMKLGYYWPSMHVDAKAQIQRCEACLIHSSVPKKPKQEMTPITLEWPFSWWGADIVGPLLIAPGGARFLVVAIDYFTKWVETKPLVSITGKHMEKFVWKHIVCRFGAPQIIISDNGKRFDEGIFPFFCQRLGILQSFTSVYHPQGWVDELPHVLWAHRTTPKSSNGETPFSLTYGFEAIVPIDISVETKRIKEFEARPKQ